MAIAVWLLQSLASATAHYTEELKNMDLTIMKNNSLKLRIRRLASAAIALTALMVVAACSVSYKFNMASIDYSKVGAKILPDIQSVYREAEMIVKVIS